MARSGKEEQNKRQHRLAPFVFPRELDKWLNDLKEQHYLIGVWVGASLQNIMPPSSPLILLSPPLGPGRHGHCLSVCRRCPCYRRFITVLIVFCVPPSSPLRSERDTTDRADKRHTHEQHKRERERVERGTRGGKERRVMTG